MKKMLKNDLFSLYVTGTEAGGGSGGVIDPHYGSLAVGGRKHLEVKNTKCTSQRGDITDKNE